MIKSEQMTNKQHPLACAPGLSYVPLRVYSTYSRGWGAVDAAELADWLGAARLPALAVTDPFAVQGWEAFWRQARGRGLKALLGVEVRLRGLGALLLFPRNNAAYSALVDTLNQRRCASLDEMVVVLAPQSNIDLDGALTLLQRQVGPGLFYLGLEWTTPRVAVAVARSHCIPLVWAQPLRWLGVSERFAAAAAVFRHRPFSEVKAGMDRTHGPLSARAVCQRWGDTGREALRNTFVVADAVDFTFSGILPACANGGTRLEKMVRSCVSRGRLDAAETARLLRELRVVREMGVGFHFEVAAEIASYCRRMGIYFNLRGSGVSSLLLYLLGASRVHPLRHNLLFERFLNRLREEPPDIDMDLDSSRRDEVLRWVFETYAPRVAFVSTHRFFRARSALYEMARCSGFAPEEAHALGKQVPMFAEPRELAGRGEGRSREVFRAATLLQGVYRDTALHVGGVVFCNNGDVRDHFPVSTSPSGFPQMAWDKHTIERLRVFKLDLLGVRGFHVIAPVALGKHVDMTDALTWGIIRAARTIGCFQLESPLARQNLEQAAPQNLGQLGIAIAIIRPGPARSGMKAAYIARKAPVHPLLGRVFPHTRGTLIFEEQISVLLHTLTGWELDYCEKVRREMKKRREAAYRDAFLQAGTAGGFSASELEFLWKLAVDFSLYAFNQAHSTAYAYSAFLSAWFKAHFPATFFCRLLNAGGGYYPQAVYIREALEWGISVLPPHVNRSAAGFTEEAGAIRAGLLQVRGVGGVLAERILTGRRQGYAGLEGFMARSGCGERELSALMAVGALAGLGGEGYGPERLRRNQRRYLGFMPGPGRVDKSAVLGDNPVSPA
ncbi:MAG TPA: hypothetical protein ENN40_10840 [Candidatus Aminicenantes bacterium]|nr:hypothetical protein [Candidatus Aminicenantes bacterium]